MKKLIQLSSILVTSTFLLLMTPSISQAGYGPPRYGNHVTYYDCKGPYVRWWYKQIYYDCYADYDWWAEVFMDQDDMRVNTPAVWYV